MKNIFLLDREILLLTGERTRVNRERYVGASDLTSHSYKFGLPPEYTRTSGRICSGLGQNPLFIPFDYLFWESRGNDDFP